MPRGVFAPKATFIKVIMQVHTLTEAAEKLGCSRQAVSQRLQRYHAAGVKGLPEFTRELDVDEVQELVNKQRGK